MVYVTGDTHGDFSRFTSPAARRLRRGDTLIVLGDFGFLWDGSRKEKKVLKKMSRLKYSVLFLDGPARELRHPAGVPGYRMERRQGAGD